MANELKGTIINMKTLSQDIKDPIIVGSSQAQGRFLTIIFTQEAAAQFSDNTVVYLSWRHIQKNVKGYNAFTKFEYEDEDEITAEEQPPTWYIYYPKNMLHEGDVIATIELVDEISVAASTTFSIHVTADPWDGTNWIEEDDLTEFKTAIIRAQHLQQEVDEHYAEIAAELEEMKKMHDFIDFVDKDKDGINDDDAESNLQEIVNNGDIEIIEWTGGE